MPGRDPRRDAGRSCQSQRGAMPGDAAITEKGFATTALRAGGKVLMVPREDAHIARIPAPRAGEHIAAAHAGRPDPGHGPTSATRAAVIASARDQWPRLTWEARAFAGG